MSGAFCRNIIQAGAPHLAAGLFTPIVGPANAISGRWVARGTCGGVQLSRVQSVPFVLPPDHPADEGAWVVLAPSTTCTGALGQGAVVLPPLSVCLGSSLWERDRGEVSMTGPSSELGGALVMISLAKLRPSACLPARRALMPTGDHRVPRDQDC